MKSKMKKLLKHTVFIASFLMLFATQASAWVNKGFNPNNVSQVTVIIRDGAKKGCWTNISEVKRYTEDKLELAGFRVSRDNFSAWIDDSHFVLEYYINATRQNDRQCFGNIYAQIFRATWINNIEGYFSVGQADSIYSGVTGNMNQVALSFIGELIEEINQ